jgi:enoyl-CoA hydratase/carnithine racemase
VTAEVVTPQAWSHELGSGPSTRSPLTGPAVLVVDGDWTAGGPPGADSRPSLVPVIGRLREPLSSDAVPLADACDVLVATAGDEAPGVVAGGDDVVQQLVEQVSANPVAATLLCQLLRDSGQTDVAAGLLAESLAYATLQSGAEFRRWVADRPPAVPPRPSSSSVVVDRVDGLLTVHLDRPEVHNALDVAMRDALVEAFELVADDPSITSVRFTGSGPSFCSGGDLREFATTPDPAVGHAIRSMRLPARSLARVADRVEAVVHGACVGAGVELAAFAWSVEARPDTTFRLPEVGMGLVPGAGGTVSLPRRMGRHRTGWLALSGVALDAATAQSWGLVDRVVA